MFVLRRGPDWSRRIDCKTCMSDLHVLAEDVKITHPRDERMFHIVCPVCNNKNVLELSTQDIKAIDAHNVIGTR